MNRHPRFSLTPLAGHGGGRHHGPPNARSGFPANEHDDEQLTRARMLRKLLLAACGGCEQGLYLMQRLSDGEVTNDQFAADCGIPHRGTASRKVRAARRDAGRAIVIGMTAITTIIDAEPAFTLDVAACKLLKQPDAWAVGIGGLERSFTPAPDLFQVVRYVADHKLKLLGRSRCYLAGWRDEEGRYHLDVVRLFRGRVEAQQIAEQAGGSSLRHLRFDSTIRLGKEERRAA